MAKGIHNERYRRLIEWLADERRRAGLSQDDVARRLGKRQQFVSKVESGERRIDVIEFVEFVEALGFTAGDILKRL